MGNAIAARTEGDNYQALVFWKYVNLMLRESSDIGSIGYEDNSVKSFDDVVINYKNKQRFRDGFVSTDYIQVKFHMRQSDFFTFDNLLDPAFINASANSLMDNIVVYQKKYDKNGIFIGYDSV